MRRAIRVTVFHALDVFFSFFILVSPLEKIKVCGLVKQEIGGQILAGML